LSVKFPTNGGLTFLIFIDALQFQEGKFSKGKIKKGMEGINNPNACLSIFKLFSSIYKKLYFFEIYVCFFLLSSFLLQVQIWVSIKRVSHAKSVFPMLN